MKLSFKIGAIKINATVPAPIMPVTTRDPILPAPWTEIKPKDIRVSVDASELTVECEVGEIAGVCEALLPAFKELMSSVTAVKRHEIDSAKCQATYARQQPNRSVGESEVNPNYSFMRP